MRSTTGNHLRKLFRVEKSDISDLCPGDIDGVKYAPVPNAAMMLSGGLIFLIN